MYLEKIIGVVVPAYNEERLIGKTLTTMPDYVDKIIVVNDGSKDRTKDVILEKQIQDERIILVDHPKNKGLGQSLIDGYLKSVDLECDIIAVMAGDAQMSPDELQDIIDPIAAGKVDYVKGNRLLHENVIERMPTHRYIGNSGLTLLTKFATGYWKSMDPQCGYTAISLRALRKIPIESMIKGYGYNAHILNMLNIENFKITDVEIEPIYGEEVSNIKLSSYIPRISWLLFKLFWRRLIRKHLLRDFNPMSFFYFLSFFGFLFVCLPLSARFIYLYLLDGIAPSTTLIILSFSFTNAIWSLFFGMWLDMEENRNLWLPRKFGEN